MTWKKKQANWQIVTAALVINEEHMSDYNKTLKLLCPTRLGRRTNPMIQKDRTCQTTGASWDATLAKFRSKTRFTGRI